MTREFEDQYGRTMLVGPAEPGEAYLKVSDHLGEFCPKAVDLVEIAVALHESVGLPVPVITPRPDIDPRHDFVLGTLRMRARDGRVRLAAGRKWRQDVAPADARRAAGFLVALADAAETAAPDPAEVDALALVLVEGRNAMGLDGARPLARRILAAGWRKPAGEDGGNA